MLRAVSLCCAGVSPGRLKCFRQREIIFKKIKLELLSARFIMILCPKSAELLSSVISGYSIPYFSMLVSNITNPATCRVLLRLSNECVTKTAHTFRLRCYAAPASLDNILPRFCFDTHPTAFIRSSELGVLSSRPPRLVTSPWRVVPRVRQAIAP